MVFERIVSVVLFLLVYKPLIASIPLFHLVLQMQEDQGVLATNLRLLALHSRLLGPLISSSGEEAGLVLPFTGPVLSLLLQLLETGKLLVYRVTFFLDIS